MEGQFAGGQVAADQQVMPGEAAPSHAHAYQRCPLDPVPAERICLPCLLPSRAAACLQVSLAPSAKVRRELEGATRVNHRELAVCPDAVSAALAADPMVRAALPGKPAGYSAGRPSKAVMSFARGRGVPGPGHHPRP